MSNLFLSIRFEWVSVCVHVHMLTLQMYDKIIASLNNGKALTPPNPINILSSSHIIHMLSIVLLSVLSFYIPIWRSVYRNMGRKAGIMWEMAKEYCEFCVLRSLGSLFKMYFATLKGFNAKRVRGIEWQPLSFSKQKTMSQLMESRANMGN